MEISINVTGLEEFSRKMQNLPARVQKNILTSGLRAGANVIKKDAKRFVPVDEGVLKNSIVVKKKRVRSKHVIVFKVETGQVTRSKKGVKTTYDGYYGAWVELGSSRAAPHPFLRPAFEMNRNDVLEAIKGKISQRIAAEAAKA